MPGNELYWCKRRQLEMGEFSLFDAGAGSDKLIF